jgi:hypothetical protein
MSRQLRDLVDTAVVDFLGGQPRSQAEYVRTKKRILDGNPGLGAALRAEERAEKVGASRDEDRGSSLSAADDERIERALTFAGSMSAIAKDVGAVAAAIQQVLAEETLSDSARRALKAALVKLATADAANG